MARSSNKPAPKNTNKPDVASGVPAQAPQRDESVAEAASFEATPKAKFTELKSGERGKFLVTERAGDHVAGQRAKKGKEIILTRNAAYYPVLSGEIEFICKVAA